jgi:hypothetical protein
VIEQEPLDIFHVCGRNVFYGVRIFAVFVSLEETIPLRLGFGEWSDFTSDSAAGVALFATLFEESFPLLGISSLGGEGKAGSKDGDKEQDKEGADGVHDDFLSWKIVNCAALKYYRKCADRKNLFYILYNYMISRICREY